VCPGTVDVGVDGEVEGKSSVRARARDRRLADVGNLNRLDADEGYISC
jgi:hypothetical protein